MKFAAEHGPREVNAEDRLKSVPQGEASLSPTAAVSQPTDKFATQKLSGPVKAALAALRIYKVFVSPWFGGGCRFEPTCSVYMYQAIERFGVLRGMWLGVKRLARCQPLSQRFGYDPVPENDMKLPTGCAETRETGAHGGTPKEAHS
jgi:uncharacterized protein